MDSNLKFPIAKQNLSTRDVFISLSTTYKTLNPKVSVFMRKRNPGVSQTLKQGFPTKGATWSFRFLCCIFVLSCSVYPVLIFLHNQCLITACLVHGLQFSPKRYRSPKIKKRLTHAISAEISKLAHMLARDMLKYFRGARTYQYILGVRVITKVGNHCSKVSSHWSKNA